MSPLLDFLILRKNRVMCSQRRAQVELNIEKELCISQKLLLNNYLFCNREEK